MNDIGPRQQRIPIATVILFALVLGVGVWSYWPVLFGAYQLWNRQPDYSHGYLIIPAAAFLLWSRKDLLQTETVGPSAWGLVLLLLGVGVRYLGVVLYVESLEHLSFLIWLAGTCWLLFGTRTLLWALPVIVFMGFLFPLPFRVESWFANPLQRVATITSNWVFQLLGFASVARGNSIVLTHNTISVVDACNGLRMVMAFAALSFGYAIFARRSLWESFLVLAAALPIALICNIGRIVATGCFYESGLGEIGRRLTHDLAGFVMMPVALLFLMFLLWYVDHLLPTAQVATTKQLIR